MFDSILRNGNFHLIEMHVFGFSSIVNLIMNASTVVNVNTMGINQMQKKWVCQFVILLWSRMQRSQLIWENMETKWIGQQKVDRRKDTVENNNKNVQKKHEDVNGIYDGITNDMPWS